MNKLSIQILSVSHREKLIAEVQFKNYVIAEISHDNEDFLIDIFSYNDVQMQFSFDEYIRILEEAKDNLLKRIVIAF